MKPLANRIRRARSRGFTLIEVLVCLFIVGLVASIVLAMLDIQWRRSLALGTRLDGEESIIAAQTMLRGRIEAMRAFPDARTGGVRLAMYGTGNFIAFQAPLYASAGPHSLHSFHLRLAKDNALMLYSTNLHGTADPLDSQENGWNSLRLLENVRNLEITYFGFDKVTRRNAWQERWESQSELPKLIRIRLAFATGDPRFWPVLMARPSSRLRLGCTAQTQDPDC